MSGGDSHLEKLVSIHGEKLLKDIVDWDVSTWQSALYYWEKFTPENLKGRVLELGSNRGGLSLYFALRGFDIVCSDLDNPHSKAAVLHSAYGVTDRIEYREINATDIEFGDSEFDIVCFKSVLGGVGRDERFDLQEKAIGEIYRVLKPGGYLLFAENLIASSLHSFVRTHFVKWGRSWRYVTLGELESLLGIFKRTRLTSAGFLSAFGRTEAQRNILAKLDKILVPIIPGSKRYVAIGVAQK